MGRMTSKIFDFKIFAGTNEELLNKIEEQSGVNSFYHISFVNSLRLLKGRVSKKYRKLFNRSDLLIPEGRGIKWASNRLHQSISNFYSPVDILMNIVRKSIKKKQTVFFLGSSMQAINLSTEKLRKNFPDIKIVGSYHGYFTKERSKDIVEAIKKFSPDYLFVGLGFPYQDLWIQENKNFFKKTICISVGHSFELSAGIKTRGPLWIKKYGLEGLYKGFKNPIRLFRIFKLPIFVFLVFYDKIFKKGK